MTTIASVLSPIGPVPDDWAVKPLQAVVRPLGRKNVGLVETNLLSLSYGSIVRKDIDALEGLLPESFEGYQIVEADDVVFRFTDLQNDQRSLRSGLAQERGIITSAYLAVRPTSINARYFAYLMRAYDQEKVFYSFGGGVRQSLKFDDVKRLPIPVPSVEQQWRIADFLDRDTAQIDKQIAKQEQLISTLGERRQAAIDLAVGEASQEATSGFLKFFGNIRYGLGEPPPYVEEGTALIRATNVVGDGSISDQGLVFVDPDDIPPSRVFWLRSGDIVVVRSGANTGDVALVTDKYAGSIAGFDMVFRPHAKLVPEYALACLLSSPVRRAQIDLMRMRAAQPHLSAPELGGVKVSVPDVSCQKIIVTELGPKLSQLAELASDARASIDLLRERRQALISAAVTGQIHVGGASG